METIILVMGISILNIVCFFIGAKVGQKVVNKEELKLPTMNPIRIIEEHKERAERIKELEETKISLENIDNYNGSGLGQKEI